LVVSNFSACPLFFNDRGEIWIPEQCGVRAASCG
jgi:hypothetical protein